MNIKKNLLNIFFVFIFVIGLFSNTNIASAGTIELQGSAWSGNVGWISFNCSNTNSCSTSNYKVVWDDMTGSFSGYAWNENIGWIYFDPNLSSCPNSSGTVTSSPNCRPRMMYQSTTANGNTYTIGGFVRTVSNSSNWSGYIDLTGMNLGFPTPANSGMPRPFSGYIWGSDVLGWIDTTGVFMSSYTPNVSVTLTIANSNLVGINSNEVSPDQNVVLLWSSQNATSCVKSKTIGGVNQPSDAWVVATNSLTGTKGVNVGSVDSIYSITCSNPNTANKTVTASIPISFSGFPSVTLSVDKNYVRFIKAMTGTPDSRSVNAVNLSWTSNNATSCIGSKKINGSLQPNENVGTLSSYQWSGLLWSGNASSQSKTNTVYVGGKDKDDSYFPAIPDNVEYSIKCLNSSTGKYKTASVNVSLIDAMGDLVSSDNLVDYPNNNNTSLMMAVANDYKPAVYKYSNNGTNLSYPLSSVTLNGNNYGGEFAVPVYYSNASMSPKVQSVGFYIRKSSTNNTGVGNLYVAVKSNNNGTPGSVLSTVKSGSPLLSYDSTSWQKIEGELETPVSLSGSSGYYWIVFRIPPNRSYDIGGRNVTGGDQFKYSSSLSNPSFSNFSGNFVADYFTSRISTTVYPDIECNASKYVNNIQKLDSNWSGVQTLAGGMNVGFGWPVSMGVGRINKSVPVGPSSSLYKINCYNKNLPVESYISETPVNVINSLVTLPSITSFTASPDKFSTPTGNTLLSWVAVNATSCDLNKTSPSYAILGSGFLIEDSINETVTANSTYKLTCTDGVNVVSKSLDVLVNVPGPAPTVSLSATVNPVTDNYRITKLYWSASSTANSCRLTRASDGAQLYPPLPAMYGNVTSNTPSTGISTSVVGLEDTYTVECRDSASQSGFDSKNIKVAPPVPAVVGFGVGVVGTLSTNAVTGSVKTLLWSVSGVNSCVASSNPGTPWKSGNISGIGSTNVTVRSTPGNQQYTLSCLDTYDNPVAPVTVNITVQIPGPSIDRFEAFPPSITSVSDNKIRIEWESSNTNSCALSRTSPDNVSYGNNLPVDGTQNNITISTNGLAGVATDVYHLDCVQNSTLRHDVRDLSVQVDTLTKKIKVIER